MAEYGKNKGYQKKGTAHYTGSTSGLSLTTGDEIPLFVSELFNDSDSISKSTDYRAVLKAGKKYYVETVFAFTSVTVGANLYFTWYNITGGSNFGNSGNVVATNYTTNTFGGTVKASGYITPTVDITISCRVSGIAGTIADVLYQSTRIEEVEALLSETLGKTRFTENATFDGYTKLGSGAPAIKCKKLTGTSASTQGGDAAVPHGIDISKIVSCDCFIYVSATEPIQKEYTRYATYQFSVGFDATHIYIKNSAANSSNILSKPIKILLWYEE